MRTTVLVLLFALVAAFPAPANLLLYEGFDYPVGDELNGKVNPYSGSQWSKPTAPAGDSTTALIRAGNLSYDALPPSTGNTFGLPRQTQSNVSRIAVPGAPYDPTTEDTTLYFSFVMEMTDWESVSDETAASATHRDGDFIAGFTYSSGSVGMTSGAVYAGMMRIRRELDEFGTQTGKYELGIHKNNFFGGIAYLEWDTTQSFGIDERLFIVGQYEFGTTDLYDDVVRLWINPTPGAPAGDPAVEVSDGIDVTNIQASAQLSINSFWLRDGNTYLPGPLHIDELRIGTTFESVAPAGKVGLIGDYNGDGAVDAADYVVWRKDPGSFGGDPGGYNVWRTNFGAIVVSGFTSSALVPEPGSAVLLMLGVAIGSHTRRRMVSHAPLTR